MYPADEHPFAQWDYQKYYEESFDEASHWFDDNVPQVMKLFYAKSSPSSLGKPAAITSTVRKDGGWFHGAKTAPEIPLELTMLSDDLYQKLVSTMRKTSFFGADASYMNHDLNQEFVLANRKNEGILNIPCLFIQARYDTICDTVTSRLLEPMTQMCKNFSFANVDSGHWNALERPVETNSILVKWLVQEVSSYWPGSLQNAVVKDLKCFSR